MAKEQNQIPQNTFSTVFQIEEVSKSRSGNDVLTTHDIVKITSDGRIFLDDVECKDDTAVEMIKVMINSKAYIRNQISQYLR